MEGSEIDENYENIDSTDIQNLPIATGTLKFTPMASLLYVILHISSLLMPLVMILTFFNVALNSNFLHWRIYFIMIDVMSWWGTYLLGNLSVGKLILILLKIIHKPREGLFRMDSNDSDYYYFVLRAAIKKQIFWVWNNFCFPWVSNFVFKVLNMKADFKSTLFDGWSDTEFIELGDNIMLGQGACILSSTILGDYLLVKKVIIGDHVVIGGNALVAPGTIIGKNTTLGVWAKTHINQKLEPGWIYIGSPARRYKPAIVARAEIKKETMRRVVNTGERIPMELKKYTREKKLD